MKEIIFGTSRLHQISKSNRYKLIEEAVKLGIKHFDTSPYYGFGIAEKEIGNFIKKNSYINLKISTKFGLYPPKEMINGINLIYIRRLLYLFSKKFYLPSYDWSIDSAEKSLTLSLKRLNREYIDFLFVHEPNNIDNFNELEYWLNQKVLEGKVLKWGVAGQIQSIQYWLNNSKVTPQVTQSAVDDDYYSKKDYLGFDVDYLYSLITSNKRLNNQNIKDTLKYHVENNNCKSFILSTNSLKHLKENFNFIREFC